MSPWGAMKLHPLGEWAMGPHPSGFALGMIWTHCPFTLGMQYHCTPRAHVAQTYCLHNKTTHTGLQMKTVGNGEKF